MKIQIFVEDADEILIDRTFAITDRKAPNINLQELVDTAYTYLDQQLKDEANRLTQHND